MTNPDLEETFNGVVVKDLATPDLENTFKPPVSEGQTIRGAGGFHPAIGCSDSGIKLTQIFLLSFFYAANHSSDTPAPAVNFHPGQLSH